jgi:enoyl-CoA hydratase/carnithine racemase
VIEWQVRADGVAVITLYRPPVNAFDATAKVELLRRLTELETRKDVHSLIIRSALPRTFCAGSDLRELADSIGRPGTARERTRDELELWRRLSALPQVSIAAIDGHALGSGLELAIACDFRIAGAASSLGLPEVTIGGAPGVQTLTRLPALVGAGAAGRMLLLGQRLAADEAASVGLVHEVTPAGTAFDAALQVTQRVSRLPRTSIVFIKASLSHVLDGAIDSIAAVAEHDVEDLFAAPPLREGIRAFLEGHAPAFDHATQEPRT